VGDYDDISALSSDAIEIKIAEALNLRHFGWMAA
jgi:hypothetical protein